MERVIKPSILNKLKADRENKDAQIKEIKRFYVKVPYLEAHTNHPSGQVEKYVALARQLILL